MDTQTTRNVQAPHATIPDALPIFCIEGIPGSGKSTTTAYLHEILSELVPTRLFHEGTPEPPVGLPWSVAQARTTIAQTTPQTYPFSSWRRLDQERGSVTILDARFLQHTALFWFLQQGDNPAQMPTKITQLVKQRPLHLILLQPQDARTHTERTIRERAVLYPHWFPFVRDLFEGLPWCAARGLRGAASFVEPMVAWDALQREIVKTLPVSTCILHEPHKDWEVARDTLREVALNALPDDKTDR